MLERVWRKGNTLALLVGVYIDTAAMEDSMEILLEIILKFLIKTLNQKLKKKRPHPLADKWIRKCGTHT